MTHAFHPRGDALGVRAALAALDPEAETASIQALIAPGPHADLHALRDAVTQSPVPMHGGLFPGLLLEGELHAEGALLIAHRGPTAGFFVPDAAALDRLTLPGGTRTLFVFFDAATNVEPLLDGLYDLAGLDICCLGGGAGRMMPDGRPCLIEPTGLRAGGAVIIASPRTCSLGLSHGWTPVGDALLVTEADGCDLLSLDWRPAAAAYRQAIAAHTALDLGAVDFERLSGHYPLMLERMDAPGIIRDPIALLPDGGLRCAGAVPLHAPVRIVTASRASMIDAALAARRDALEGAVAPRFGLTFDCVSRSARLGDAVERELAALRVPGVPQAGALMIGEIGRERTGYLELHNKTAVLGLLEAADQDAA